jgi:DNA-binding response OmpR family regulator
VRARSGRILIVDDNHDAADSIAEMLRLEGWEPCVEYDGISALRCLEGQGFDAALLDIGMPHMDGNELAQRIRSLGHTQLFLVALTGWGQSRDRSLSHAAGFDHHLVKPVGMDALIGVLDHALARSQPRTS